MIFRNLLPLAAVIALGACVSVPEVPDTPAGPVTVKIVGLNDFHGNLEPLSRPIGLTDDAGAQHAVRAGGAAYLASAVAKYRTGGDYSLVIAAGDLIGGSPLVSSLFLDEPAIGAMNRIGLDFNAVGNHEFDRGWRELKRMQDGGCDKHGLRNPCAVERDFGGADFSFLAANVLTEGGTTLFPGYAIRRFGAGAREIAVGVIGLTLEETPTLVTPSGVAGLTFGDEAEAINALVPEIERQGADAIVVAIHQGLQPEPGTPLSGCGAIAGPLRAILERLDPRVDLVISGHTHRTYVCDFATVDPARAFTVSSAGYGGTLLTDIALTIDPAVGEVTDVTARNVVVQNGGIEGITPDPSFDVFQPDPELVAYVARYAQAAQAAEMRPVGRISGPAPDPGPATEETALGNLIADAQLFATRDAGAQIALMNNSGVRAPIVPDADGTVTFGDIYAAQPFGNALVTKSYTGAQLLALLEQQFDEDGFVQTFSVSEGFAFSYDMGRPAGRRVVSATLEGEPIDPAATYRVTMNSFLAAGGDTFTVFADGADAVTGPTDLDAMEEYLSAAEMRHLPAVGRVTALTRD
ncbi:bifunctional metallophosphatase/5'-nucleotidase [Altererythrobacter sp. C41]|uniref:bifunctional metallophosphatase/5'-nucleotidase n=1 Tax=Altererythrobacter sp. C41 TaxID=2806021 RepID=UPI0019339CCF|nr:bifunctional metallophosphatase/5'-nucleotidase [Altererythrobacter sp. C41]MBM0169555.1 bifunctional metallophosphatase/5'-nucleotidase [Altererythrobacter sp. C41]